MLFRANNKNNSRHLYAFFFFTAFTKPHHTIGYYNTLHHSVLQYRLLHHTILYHTTILHHIFSLLYLYYFVRLIQSLNKKTKITN